jgi:hypothetical protein
MLHNPFVAKQHALAHATFNGRFAQFIGRHHRHFRPIIVIGWVGPLFWPYAYDDFLDYTFYPYAYDAFWPYAYDDAFAGIIGAYGPGTLYAAPSGGGRAAKERGAIASPICAGEAPGITDWRLHEIAQAVEPNEAQRAALDDLGNAMLRARDILKGACPTDLPSTPTGRIEAMHVRLSAMLEAVRTVHAALGAFYEQLTDEQKARFNALPFDDENEAVQRRDIAQLCGTRAVGISMLPLDRLERVVEPSEAQRASLRELRKAVTQASELLQTDCPTYRPLTPVVRLEAMEQRLDAMLRAIETVQPALQSFYGSLTDEQKERFNRLQPGQS